MADFHVPDKPTFPFSQKIHWNENTDIIDFMKMDTNPYNNSSLDKSAYLTTKWPQPTL